MFPFFCGRNERPSGSFIARIQNRTVHQLQNQCTPCLCTQPDHSDCDFSGVQCGVIFSCHRVLQCFMVGVMLFLCTGNPTTSHHQILANFRFLTSRTIQISIAKNCLLGWGRDQSDLGSVPTGGAAFITPLPTGAFP